MYPNTQSLIDGIACDLMPNFATFVDFGIEPSADPTKVFGALQWAVRHGQVTNAELNLALGNGRTLTEIVNRGNNPYACTIKTMWDNMPPEEEDDNE